MENKAIIKNKNVKRIALAAIAVTLAAALAALPFAIDKNTGAETKATVRSASVEKGSIQKTISGTGTLTDEDAVELSIPEGVKMTGYLVSDGQTVSKGDKVAKVDRASVMETISAAREAMDEITEELSSASNGKYTAVKAPAPGRVKAVYAEKGRSAVDIVREYGSLAILSLDGLMAAKLPADGLAAGDAVSVLLSDGKEIDGSVESLTEEQAVVTISDRYGSIGELVEIRTPEGKNLGTAELYVHSGWKAVANTGTVQALYKSEGQSCSKGDTILEVDGMDDTRRALLLEEYRDYEEIMATLFQLYQAGAAVAPCDGIVSGVDESLVTKIELRSGSSVDPSVVPTVDPSSDPALKNPLYTDEAYTNYVGIVTAKNEDGTISVRRQSYDFGIDNNDYRTLPYLNTDEGNLTEEINNISPAPAYSWSESTGWTGSGIEVGHIFIFAYGGGGMSFMVYVGHRDIQPQNEQGQNNGGGQFPDGAMNFGGGGSFGGGSFGGGGSFDGMTDGGQDAAENDPSVSKTILSVTPGDKVTVSITIDELDILSIRVGQEVTVTLDALAGQAFSGVITEVNTTPSNDGGHSKYSAVVELERTEKMLGGMNASAQIVVEERNDVLLIPSEALAEINGQPAVYTAYDSKTGEFGEPADIEIGLSDGMKIQILSGLCEGDEIWYETYDKLEIEGLS